MTADDDRARALSALAAACEDAVRIHGPDWTKVRAHVDAYLAGLRPADRQELTKAAETTAAHPGEEPRRLH